MSSENWKGDNNSLCDEEEGHKADEIKLLSHEFISSGYEPKDVDRIIGSYVFVKPDNDTEAEHRTDTLCIPYVRGASDRLRKKNCQRRSECCF